MIQYSSDGDWETASSLMCDEQMPSDPEEVAARYTVILQTHIPLF